MLRQNWKSYAFGLALIVIAIFMPQFLVKGETVVMNVSADGEFTVGPYDLIRLPAGETIFVSTKPFTVTLRQAIVYDDEMENGLYRVVLNGDTQEVQLDGQADIDVTNAAMNTVQVTIRSYTPSFILRFVLLFAGLILTVGKYFASRNSEDDWD